MAYTDLREILNTAKESFIEGDYRIAEPLLQQALLKDSKNPEVYQMLATIYYDRGQFNKAIKTFQKALEIDPSYTDASVGLSIILNDIGRYDEAKEVFLTAQQRLDESKKQGDPFIEQKISQKHMELGDLYLQIERIEEALEQFLKAKKLMSRPGDVILKVAECFMKMNKLARAVQELQIYLREYPQDVSARVRLGSYLYQMNRVFEAVEEWERVLLRDPSNSEAKHCLQLARETRLTEIATHDDHGLSEEL
jgi:tetratricopeptide (TPR) repeat protein